MIEEQEKNMALSKKQAQEISRRINEVTVYISLVKEKLDETPKNVELIDLYMDAHDQAADALIAMGISMNKYRYRDTP